jgi:hypothetical protein
MIPLATALLSSGSFFRSNGGKIDHDGNLAAPEEASVLNCADEQKRLPRGGSKGHGIGKDDVSGPEGRYFALKTAWLASRVLPGDELP